MALKTIETDIVSDGVNLVHLGEACALLVGALQYCKRHEVTELRAGLAGYQATLPEQRPVAIEAFTRFAATIGITFMAPLADVLSEDEVKERLWEKSLSPKSLERSSMFADCHGTADDPTILAYLDRRWELMRRILNPGAEVE